MVVDIKAACETVVRVPGRYRGRTIARVGAADEGLVYLDKLREEPDLDPALREALETYLHHPLVVPKLHAALHS